MIRKLKQLRNELALLPNMRDKVKKLESAIEETRIAIGRIENRQVIDRIPPHFRESEFKVFSQWGEDGLLQYVFRQIKVPRKIFVEFGVEDYTEANTRFLLVKDNWSGLVMDGSPDSINRIKKEPIYWRHNLKAVHAFITRENINELLVSNGCEGDIGLLSIDVDGMDYWIWQAIDVVQPAVVVVEYNSLFGRDKSVSIPYDPGFVRTRKHWSNLYYGASLKALCKLGKIKGYALIFCNSAGNNAFFVRRDLLPEANWERPPEEAFVERKFREGRNRNGKLTFFNHAQEEAVIEGLPLEFVP